MTPRQFGSLEEVLALRAEERIEGLVALADGPGEVDLKLIEAMVASLEGGAGDRRDRLALGRSLGIASDPRIRPPSDDGYFVSVQSEHEPIIVARFPVTNSEFQAWVDAGGYDDADAWSEDGLAWLQSCTDPWPVLASGDGAGPFVIPNHPVVGVTWFEADAYARAMGARLVYADERVWVTRGAERRPYPWGAPFGEGNANTREEALQGPCAVGLYIKDATPEGIRDLAGNVAEWHGDAPVVGDERLVHPGCWDQPSMAAWAKALTFERPGSRRSSLGFRLAKDP